MRLLSLAAWIAIDSAIAELCAREVARRSLFAHTIGVTPGVVSLLIGDILYAVFDPRNWR